MTITTICIAGLGYVGLPLALHLAKHFSVIGFDVKDQRVQELQQKNDASGEISREEFSGTIEFTTDQTKIKEAQFVIACVPTPVDEKNKPDLSPVEGVSRIIGKNLASGAIVVYESTVYPGVTEEICVSILEKESGLRCGRDFFVGYSPERINPGDKSHSIDKITKIVSGMDEKTLEVIDSVYGKITKTHRAPSIKVAEAAKVIENIQRDLNIALMNELAIIFDKMKINVYDVLAAAGTKWNFHQYQPGLVGGHCIGVDPYYLTHKAQQLGYEPEVILAGRKTNDGMHEFYARKIMEKLNGRKAVHILGLTFKPNVSDARNSRVKHLIEELKKQSIAVYAFDPYLAKEIVEKHFGAVHFTLENLPREKESLFVIATPHQEIMQMAENGLFAGREVTSLKGLVEEQA